MACHRLWCLWWAVFPGFVAQRGEVGLFSRYLWKGILLLYLDLSIYYILDVSDLTRPDIYRNEQRGGRMMEPDLRGLFYISPCFEGRVWGGGNIVVCICFWVRFLGFKEYVVRLNLSGMRVLVYFSTDRWIERVMGG